MKHSRCGSSYLIATFVSFLLSTSPLLADALTVVTEVLPPYQTVKDGRLQGVTIEVMNQLLERAELDGAKITAYPWARAYNMALRQKNIAIFPMSRTQEREQKFHWIGVVVPYTEYIWGLTSRSDIKIDNLEDLYRYRIALVREDSSTQYLTQVLDPNRLNHELVIDVAQGLQLMLRGRTDLLSSSEQTLRDITADPSLLKGDNVSPLLRIDALSAGLYLAVSLDTDEAIRGRLSQALHSLKEDGSYQQILMRYGLEREGLSPPAE